MRWEAQHVLHEDNISQVVFTKVMMMMTISWICTTWVIVCGPADCLPEVTRRHSIRWQLWLTSFGRDFRALLMKTGRWNVTSLLKHLAITYTQESVLRPVKHLV